MNSISPSSSAMAYCKVASVRVRIYVALCVAIVCSILPFSWFASITRADFGDDFIFIGTEFIPTSSIAWGDYDNDGDLDIAIGTGGNTESGVGLQLFQNNKGRFILDQSVDKQGIFGNEDIRQVVWGDWDNDGDLDLAALATSPTHVLIFENESSVFTLDPSNGLGWQIDDVLKASYIAWGDYDSDGDLDLAVGSSGDYLRVFENDKGKLSYNSEHGWQSPYPMNTTSLDGEIGIMITTLTLLLAMVVDSS